MSCAALWCGARTPCPAAWPRRAHAHRHTAVLRLGRPRPSPTGRQPFRDQFGLQSHVIVTYSRVAYTQIHLLCSFWTSDSTLNKIPKLRGRFVTSSKFGDGDYNRCRVSYAKERVPPVSLNLSPRICELFLIVVPGTTHILLIRG